MANAKHRLPTNTPGDFFVDDKCIDCGTCRWMAPATFDREGSHSRVHTQPTPGDDDARDRALEALVSCPVAAIGTETRHDVAGAVARFPRPIAPDIFHCGFHHRESYGAASYLITRPGGNVLVDSPRFNKPLARAIETLGGVSTMFLTHRDDVADHEAWASHFGCERVLHEDDVSSRTATVEIQLKGEDEIAFADDLTILPVPGHTKGSACLLFGDTLFTGDHLCASHDGGGLRAFRGACRYDWDVQRESMRRLLDVDFTRVLPGHGAPFYGDADSKQEALRALIAWM